MQALGEKLLLVGKEYPVPFGRIDLLAKDTKNSLVAIELKLGTASRDAIGQLQSYMGALQSAEPDVFVRGILVASALDRGAEAALHVARDIKFVSYTVAFTFREIGGGESTYSAWLAHRSAKKEEMQSEAIWLPPGFKR